MSKPDYHEVVGMLELVICLYDDTKTPDHPNGRGTWAKARELLARAKQSEINPVAIPAALMNSSEAAFASAAVSHEMYHRQIQAAEDSRPVPTEEGKRRWEPDGYYDGDPCTCKPECPAACKGQCGCEGCRTAYNDQCGELGCE